MRSHRPRWSIRLWALGLLTFALLTVPGIAVAQLTIDPTATPVRNDGGWVYWMAEGAIVLGLLILILSAAAYLRFSPRFFRDAREAKGKEPPHAPPATSVRIQYTPPPAAEPVAVGVGGGGGAAPLASPSPTPLRDAPAASAVAPAPAAAAPAAAAPATAPRPPTPKQEGPLELDQETFDRVLKEQLDKGTDRRVAEGRARSAAAKAAREKAGG